MRSPAENPALLSEPKYRFSSQKLAPRWEQKDSPNLWKSLQSFAKPALAVPESKPCFQPKGAGQPCPGRCSSLANCSATFMSSWEASNPPE